MDRIIDQEPKQYCVCGRFWEANTLAEFWQKWNPAVHKLYAKFMRWVYGQTQNKVLILMSVFAIFIFTGLWHDLVVWVITGGSSGSQFLWATFFFLNGTMVVIEKLLPFTIPIPLRLKKLLTFVWLPVSMALSFPLTNYLF